MVTHVNQFYAAWILTGMPCTHTQTHTHTHTHTFRSSLSGNVFWFANHNHVWNVWVDGERTTTSRWTTMFWFQVLIMMITHVHLRACSSTYIKTNHSSHLFLIQSPGHNKCMYDKPIMVWRKVINFPSALLRHACFQKRMLWDWFWYH